ncbi:MAG: hypothetical protein K2P14_10445 [Anaeroplasmataceae bacterium]|nr:hypothetical protein [Anaeroplasmataceae bacterium]
MAKFKPYNKRKDKIMIDLRLLAFANLFKKLEKQINTDKTKDEIRNGTAIYKFADYAQIQTKDYTQSKYSDEDQAEIDKFIAEKGFKKIATTKTNYAIEIVPSEKAIKEFDKMLNELENSQYKNIAKVASQVKSKVK